jgi:hypothetical protein
LPLLEQATAAPAHVPSGAHDVDPPPITFTQHSSARASHSRSPHTIVGSTGPPPEPLGEPPEPLGEPPELLGEPPEPLVEPPLLLVEPPLLDVPPPVALEAPLPELVFVPPEPVVAPDPEVGDEPVELAPPLGFAPEVEPPPPVASALRPPREPNSSASSTRPPHAHEDTTISRNLLRIRQAERPQRVGVLSVRFQFVSIFVTH